MLKEDTMMLPTHLLAPMNEEVELFDQQFEKGWDAAVHAAHEIVEIEVGGLGYTRVMARIRKRFLEELEMKED